MFEKYHFIGIGGIGMSGLARMLLSKNVPVTGSDLAPTYITEGLMREGAKIFIGHYSTNITYDTTVIYSSDIKLDNPEYMEAVRLKCPLLHRSDLLKLLMTDHRLLSIAGTHGKTTTTALLAAVLMAAKLDPSYAVGGMMKSSQTNAAYGSGQYFIAEADESDGTFLKYHSYGAIVTNIDLDHMNFFQTEENLIEAFRTFFSQVSMPQHLFWCGDDPRLNGLSLPGTSYGHGQHNALRILKAEQKGWRLNFDLNLYGEIYRKIELNLIGNHNVMNAAAVFGLALSLGINEEDIRLAFASFEGVNRRCDKKGDVNNILIVDDYAHHPTEIRTTLQGIRQAIGKRRLIAVYQPHRYTRTRDCMGTFGGIFDVANETIITEIYASNELEIPGVNHQALIHELRKATPSLALRHIPRKEIVKSLVQFLQPDDVVVTLGAGDITKVGAELAKQLQESLLALA